MVLFGIPIVLMMVSYCMIVWKLWSDQVPGISSSTSLRAPTRSDDSQRIKISLSRSTSDNIVRSASSSAAVVTASSSFHSGTGSIADKTAENTVQSRRKVARMLVAVVVVFAICYIPLMILTFLKRVYGFFDNTHDREGLYAAFTVSHWLLYLNSAINPLIYNFMSEKFRSEFKASLPCCFPEAARKKREARGMTVGRPTISRMHTTRTTGTTELLSRFESTTRYPSTYEFTFARDRNEFGLSRFDPRPLPKSPILPHDTMKPRDHKAPYDTIHQETDLRMIKRATERLLLTRQLPFLQSYRLSTSKETAIQVMVDGEDFAGISIMSDARHCWRKNAMFSDVAFLGDSGDAYKPSKVLIQDPKAEKLLVDFLHQTVVYKNAENYVHAKDTHYVESFNNALLVYHDKRIAFGKEAYLLRINLAILDWNENVDRDHTSEWRCEDAAAPRRREPKKQLVEKKYTFRKEVWNEFMRRVYMPNLADDTVHDQAPAGNLDQPPADNHDQPPADNHDQPPAGSQDQAPEDA
uniref:G-protein coupled receptors family 1 profile domain-containing protein n=1 Tax=Branchiostoma floridae TaxID=7739 RepID=C3YQ21_BRAFL|eukprot:XP_002601647.1 hypothetical protein BRAFLDRAFT_85768 [Branchiostoma floridae]